MRLTVFCAFLAGCSGSGTGTVVYSEVNSGHIMTVDVATGATTPIDLGFFGDVSIAADGQHVAYMGEDNIPKVTDLSGQVTELYDLRVTVERIEGRRSAGSRWATSSS